MISSQTFKEEKNARKKRGGEMGHLPKGREVEQLHKTAVDTAHELKANAV